MCLGNDCVLVEVAVDATQSPGVTSSLALHKRILVTSSSSSKSWCENGNSKPSRNAIALVLFLTAISKTKTASEQEGSTVEDVCFSPFCCITQ